MKLIIILLIVATQAVDYSEFPGWETGPEKDLARENVELHEELETLNMKYWQLLRKSRHMNQRIRDLTQQGTPCENSKLRRFFRRQIIT